MADPQVATGYNQAGSLADFTYTPNVPSIQLGLYRYALDNNVYEDASRRASFVWGPQLPDTAISTILTELGFSTTDITSEVTVKLPLNYDRTATANYNALAVKPRQWPEYRNGAWSGPIVIDLLYLEAI